VVFTRDGETVATRTVALGPRESTTVSASVRLPETGQVDVSAANHSTRVRVRESVLGPESVPVPGLGAPAAVVAVAVFAGLFRRFSAE
jgi:hypothetical protein